MMSSSVDSAPASAHSNVSFPQRSSSMQTTPQKSGTDIDNEYSQSQTGVSFTSQNNSPDPFPSPTPVRTRSNATNPPRYPTHGRYTEGRRKFGSTRRLAAVVNSISPLRKKASIGGLPYGYIPGNRVEPILGDTPLKPSQRPDFPDEKLAEVGVTREELNQPSPVRQQVTPKYHHHRHSSFHQSTPTYRRYHDLSLPNSPIKESAGDETSHNPHGFTSSPSLRRSTAVRRPSARLTNRSTTEPNLITTPRPMLGRSATSVSIASQKSTESTNSINSHQSGSSEASSQSSTSRWRQRFKGWASRNRQDLDYRKRFGSVMDHSIKDSSTRSAEKPPGGWKETLKRSISIRGSSASGTDDEIANKTGRVSGLRRLYERAVGSEEDVSDNQRRPNSFKYKSKPLPSPSTFISRPPSAASTVSVSSYSSYSSSRSSLLDKLRSASSKIANVARRNRHSEALGYPDSPLHSPSMPPSPLFTSGGMPSPFISYSDNESSLSFSHPSQTSITTYSNHKEDSYSDESDDEKNAEAIKRFNQKFDAQDEDSDGSDSSDGQGDHTITIKPGSGYVLAGSQIPSKTISGRTTSKGDGNWNDTKEYISDSSTSGKETLETAVAFQMQHGVIYGGVNFIQENSNSTGVRQSQEIGLAITTSSTPEKEENNPWARGVMEKKDLSSKYYTPSGYGCLALLFSSNEATVGTYTTGGSKFLLELLELLDRKDFLNLALTSKDVYAFAMNALFQHIHFDPVSTTPIYARAVHNEALIRQAIVVEPYETKDNNVVKFRKSHDLATLFDQLLRVEKMFFFKSTSPSAREVRKPNGNSTIVRSISFSSNWGWRGSWQNVVTLVESVLKRLDLKNLESLVWDMEVPLTSGTLARLSSVRGSLKTLSINGYCPKLKLSKENEGDQEGEGEVLLTTFRPTPLSRFKNLTTLDLRKLQIGKAGELDRRYMRDIFGVIIRSPKLAILKLGAGAEDEGGDPGLESVRRFVQDSTNLKRGLTYGNTEGSLCEQEVQDGEGGTFNPNSCKLRPWLDMPVFDYQLFKEACDAHTRIRDRSCSPSPAFIYSNRRLASSVGTSAFPTSPIAHPHQEEKTLPSIPTQRLRQEPVLPIRLNLKKLYLHGFAVDINILNSQELSPGSIEKLSLVGCRYLPVRSRTGRHSEHYSKAVLHGEVTEALKSIRLDEGLLSSMGEGRASQILTEIFLPRIDLPPALIIKRGKSAAGFSTDEPDRNLSQREIYISPSTYPKFDPSTPGFASRTKIQDMIMLLLKIRASIEVEKTDEIGVLAMSSGWDARLQKADLTNFMRPSLQIGTGLRELGLGLQGGAWHEFLILLPNLNNLAALYLYIPYCRSFPSLNTNSIGTIITTKRNTVSFVSSSHRSTATIPILQASPLKMIHGRLPRSEVPTPTKPTKNSAPPAKTIHELLQKIPEQNRDRYVVRSATAPGQLRRRYPADDAVQIVQTMVHASQIVKIESEQPKGRLSEFGGEYSCSGSEAESDYKFLDKYYLSRASSTAGSKGVMDDGETTFREGSSPLSTTAMPGQAGNKGMPTANPTIISLKYIAVGRGLWKVVRTGREPGIYRDELPKGGFVPVPEGGRATGTYALKRVHQCDTEMAGVKIFGMGKY